MVSANETNGHFTSILHLYTEGMLTDMLIEVDFKMIGLLISQYRYKANLSQEKLAEKIDVSTNFLGNIERGVKHPSVETLFKICIALELPPNELINSKTARVVSDEEKHRLRDAASGFAHTLSDILLAEQEANAPEDAPESRFGYLEIGSEYDFTWKD